MMPKNTHATHCNTLQHTATHATHYNEGMVANQLVV